MKKILSFLFIVLLSKASICQSRKSIDSIVVQICNTVGTEIKASDSLTLQHAFDKHLPAFFSLYKSDSTFDPIFFRLQTTCADFVNALRRMDTSDKQFKNIAAFEKPKCSKKIAGELFSLKKAWYLEPDGDTTKVELTKKHWIDRMTDGTYSRLSLKQFSDYDFEITFIESNNPVKNNLSRPGDKYIYRIIDKNENYYLLQVKLEKLELYSEFKIYYRE